MACEIPCEQRRRTLDRNRFSECRLTRPPHYYARIILVYTYKALGKYPCSINDERHTYTQQLYRAITLREWCCGKSKKTKKKKSCASDLRLVELWSKALRRSIVSMDGETDFVSLTSWTGFTYRRLLAKTKADGAVVSHNAGLLIFTIIVGTGLLQPRRRSE